MGSEGFGGENSSSDGNGGMLGVGEGAQCKSLMWSLSSSSSQRCFTALFVRFAGRGRGWLECSWCVVRMGVVGTDVERDSFSVASSCW